MNPMSPCGSRRPLGRTAATAAAALVAAAAATVPTQVAHAGSGSATDTRATTGCVSNPQYARLSIGQRLVFVRSVVGETAQTSMRRWESAGGSYQERQYRMCTPVDSQHDTLTARFMRWQGAWRAQIIDTYVGPEKR